MQFRSYGAGILTAEELDIEPDNIDQSVENLDMQWSEQMMQKSYLVER